MNITTITVSSKGQIALPHNIRESASVQEGDVLLLCEHNGKILLQKAEILSEFTRQDIKKMTALQEASLNKIWDNEKDDEWSKVLARRSSPSKIPVHKSSNAKNKTGSSGLK